MNSQTLGAVAATLTHLEGALWFSRLGMEDAKFAHIVGSWDEALRICETSGWLDMLLNASNQYAARLMRVAPERFQSWNRVAEQLRPKAVDLVERKIGRRAMGCSLDPLVRNCVEWDVLHILMEAAFSDVATPGFFAGNGYWYVAGHWPCGWLGSVPDGCLVVY